MVFELALLIAIAAALGLGARLLYRSYRPAPPTTSAEASRHYKAIVDQLADGCLVLDLDVKIKMANPRALAIMERSLHEVLGCNPYDVWGAAWSNLANLENIEASIREKGFWEGETYNPTSGTSLSVRIDPMYRDQGSVEGFIAILHDATSRVKAEQAVAENRLRLQQAQELADVGYWEWDRDSGESLWSEHCMKIFGVGMSDLDRQAGMDLVNPADRNMVEQAFQTALAGRVSTAHNFRIQRPDGEHRTIRTWASPGPRDAAGEVVRVMAAFQDVTALVQAEEQLRHVQRIESLGQLTGGIAHDFNNLLHVIEGNSELLALALQDEENLELLGSVRAAASRGAELTQRLLAFSRKQQLAPRVVNLNEVVTGMLGMLRRTFSETIEISIDLQSQDPYCLVDPGQLENAVLNLCINARQAMPDSGRLRIATRDVDLNAESAAQHSEICAAGEYVCLEVEDSGVGMSKEVLDRVFDPFFTTKEIGEGSGLGLSMVHGLVHQSGGYIEIDSVPGEGTQVGLLLPRHEQAAAPAPGSTGKLGRVGILSGLALVCEDDPEVLALVVRYVENLGMEVMRASSGDSALATLRNRPPDVLISDVLLPRGENGPAVLAAAREDFPNLPGLLMSGYSGEGLDGFEDLPNTAYLSKPFSQDELAEKLSELLTTDAEFHHPIDP